MADAEVNDKLNHIVGMMRERIADINAVADHQIAGIRREINSVINGSEQLKGNAEQMVTAAQMVINAELHKLQEDTNTNFEAYKNLVISEKITIDQFKSLLNSTTQQFEKTSRDIKNELANNEAFVQAVINLKSSGCGAASDLITMLGITLKDSTRNVVTNVKRGVSGFAAATSELLGGVCGVISSFGGLLSLFDLAGGRGYESDSGNSTNSLSSIQGLFTQIENILDISPGLNIDRDTADQIEDVLSQAASGDNSTVPSSYVDSKKSRVSGYDGSRSGEEVSEITEYPGDSQSTQSTLVTMDNFNSQNSGPTTQPSTPSGGRRKSKHHKKAKATKKRKHMKNKKHKKTHRKHKRRTLKRYRSKVRK